MDSVVSYFNSFLTYLFGIYAPDYSYYTFNLLTPRSTFTQFRNLCLGGYDLWDFVLHLFSDPALPFSLFIWCWFCWLTVHLLLIWPFKWIRSVVKR